MPHTRRALTALAALVAASALSGCVVLSRQQHQQLVDELAEVEAARDKAEAELSAGSAELTNTKALLQKATKDLSDVREAQDLERGKLQEDLQAQRAAAAKLTIENTKLRLVGEDTAKTLVATATRVRQLQGELETKKQEIAALEKTVGRLNDALKKLQDQIAELTRPPAPPPQ